MKKRDIVGVVLLSVFTCGIYSLYWHYVTAEDLNYEDSSDRLMNYILAILLGIITCGIYLIYWSYLFYKKIDKVTGEENCILNFILSVFGLDVVSSAIAQTSINQYVDKKD